LALLGVSNTIPSMTGPPLETLTRSPTVIGSIGAAYRAGPSTMDVAGISAG
jgi:hypothetical protein